MADEQRWARASMAVNRTKAKVHVVGAGRKARCNRLVWLADKDVTGEQYEQAAKAGKLCKACLRWYARPSAT